MTENGIAESVVILKLKIWIAGGGDSDDKPLQVELFGLAPWEGGRKLQIRIDLHNINNVLGTLLQLRPLIAKVFRENLCWKHAETRIFQIPGHLFKDVAIVGH